MRVLEPSFHSARGGEESKEAKTRWTQAIYPRKCHFTQKERHQEMPLRVGAGALTVPLPAHLSPASPEVRGRSSSRLAGQRVGELGLLNSVLTSLFIYLFI